MNVVFISTTSICSCFGELLFAVFDSFCSVLAFLSQILNACICKKPNGTSAREWPRTTTFRCAATATSYNYNKIFKNRRNLGTYPDIHSSRVEFVYLIKAIQHYRKQDTGPKQFEFKFTNIRWRDSSHGYVRSPYMNQFPVADYVSFLLFSGSFLMSLQMKFTPSQYHATHGGCRHHKLHGPPADSPRREWPWMVRISYDILTSRDLKLMNWRVMNWRF